MTDDRKQPTTRIRWWLVALVAAGGLFALGGGWVVVFLSRGDMGGFWSGLLVSIGSTLLLAAVVFWFERSIVRESRKERAEVVGAAQEATEAARLATQAATTASESAAKAREALTSRIDEIDKQIAESRSRQAAEQADALASIGEEVSRDGILRALAEAADIGALRAANRQNAFWLVVSGGEPPDAPLVRVWYFPDQDEGFGNIDASLALEYLPADFEILRASPYVDGVQWEATAGPVEAVQLLDRSMVKRGAGYLSKKFSASKFFSNLQLALKMAIEAREGVGSTVLSSSPVAEMVTSDCFITGNGVEFTDAWVTVESWRFEHQSPEESGTFTSIPKRPDQVDEKLWGQGIRRGLMHFRGQTDEPSFF